MLFFVVFGVVFLIGLTMLILNCTVIHPVENDYGAIVVITTILFCSGLVSLLGLGANYQETNSKEFIIRNVLQYEAVKEAYENLDGEVNEYSTIIYTMAKTQNEWLNKVKSREDSLWFGIFVADEYMELEPIDIH